MPTPSLIIPSAPVYDEGLLYGLNVYGTQFFPEPIPFTRATTATRTNAAGLIELAPYNLLTYSENFNVSWTKTNVSVNANTTTAPNGTLTAYTLSIGIDASSTRHRLFTSSVTSQIVDTIYTGTYYLKANQHQWIQILGNIGYSSVWANFDLINGVIGNTGVDTTASIDSVGNGWYRCRVSGLATGASTTCFEIVTTNNTNSGRYPSYQSLVAQDVCYIWGAQLVEGTDARPYLKTETRLNRPRVDFSLGGCPNLLLEPQRTNLALQSSYFDNATWSKGNGTIIANSTTSPSGIVDADTFTANGTSNLHNLTQTISVTSGTSYALSFYAKKSTNDFIQATIPGGFPSTTFANFDLNLGVVGSVGSSATATITNVGNGWYRCTMVSTATVTTSAIFILNLITSATSVRNEVNTLNTSVFLWGAQLEAGAYPTTFIPTTTTSVTRNADSFTESNVFSRGMITAAGGTWFVELKNNVVLTRDAIARLGLGSEASFTNGLILTNDTTSRVLISKRLSGATTTLYSTTTDTAKIAIKWNGSTADVFLNGVKVVSATAFAFSAMEFFGAATTNGTPYYINQMELFPTPLSDDELEEMTGLGFNTYPLMANYYNYITQ